VIRELVRRIVNASVGLSEKTVLGRYWHEVVINSAMSQTMCVTHEGLQLVFPVPNRLCRFRAETFSTKEPETLEWIDSLPRGCVLWDIGANVGLYSVYAARRRDCRVIAFEPSVFNLELLARSAFLNGVTDKICLVPLALSDATAPNNLRLTSVEWGGALSTFGRDFGWDGAKIRPIFEFQTVGMSIGDAVERLGLPSPDYVKMDVDGIEHIILQGAGTVFNGVKGVMIEINDSFQQQAEQARRLLTLAGLRLHSKRHSPLIEASAAAFANTYNQCWVR
jgi:FkbM family methyltransferase